MSTGYSDVLGRFSTLRAASDNMLMVDNMIHRMSEAQDRSAALSMTPAERLESELGLMQVLADMIVARRAHKANTQVIASTDALLNRLHGA